MRNAFTPPSLSRLSQADLAVSAVYPTEEPVMVEGIVSARGQSAWGGRDPDHQVHSFCLAVWRHEGGSIQQQELHVMRPVPAHDIPFGVVKEGDILRLALVMAEGERRAVLASMETLAQPDDAILAAGEALAAPVYWETERFGTLTLDKQHRWFSGESTWQGHLVKLRLDDTQEQPSPLATAEALWGDEAAWAQRIADAIVDRLLALKNDVWTDDDEGPFTRETFLARLTLTTVVTSEEGRFTFWYDDGDLFGRHGIEVTGTLAEGVLHADLAG